MKKSHCAVFELETPKAIINGVLVGHTVSMVTHCARKMIVFTNDWAVFPYTIVESSRKETN